MGWRQELALAAARVRLLSEQIPERHRPDVAASWAELQDELEDCQSDGGRVLAILEWREAIEVRLSATLAHAPLTEARGMSAPLTLDAQSVEAVAHRVAELLRGEDGSGDLPSGRKIDALVDAAEIACMCNCSREFVYENADRLGAVGWATGLGLG